MRFRVVWAAAVALSMVGAWAAAEEKRIERAALPPAVEKTVREQSAGATVRGFSMEREKGEVFYEAELTVGGHSKDLLINAKGAVVEVEEEVAIDQLPSSVRTALEQEAGGGKILKVESIKKHDKLVAYEAQVVLNNKKSEVQVGPEGQPLDHRE